MTMWPTMFCDLKRDYGPKYVTLNSGKLQYQNLDFTLFCSGEMEILSSNEISVREKEARSQLFKYIIIYISLQY